MSIEKARKIVAAIEDANDRAHGAATAWCPDEAVELIAAALSAAHAEPVARDPSRFSRLSPDEPPVIRERPDPTLGFISTAEMLASPSEAAIRADDVRLGPIAHRICDMLEAAGEPRPNGDIMHDVLTRVLATAIRARGET